jgi:hypothetical protein
VKVTDDDPLLTDDRVTSIPRRIPLPPEYSQLPH